MLVNSAGYKILTSVDQYLELVNNSLPGEWSWWLRGQEGCSGSPAPWCCWASLRHLWEGVVLGCGHPCGPYGRGGFGMCASFWTLWKGWFQGVEL